MQAGIIGFGRFGALAAKILAAHLGASVLVYARRQPAKRPRGIEFAALDEVCRADVVIPCVPISAFEEIIRGIAPRLRPGALVLDVCSVKVYPVEVMKRHLPENIDIVASHPGFGPDSARRGLAGLNIVLYPVRVRPARYEKVLNACRKIGLEVIEIAPDEHDRLAAYSLAYTHLVGRIGEKLKIGSTPIDTRGFAQLLKVQGYVVNDSYTLFRDMQIYNPYAREMRRRFREALEQIEKELGSA